MSLLNRPPHIIQVQNRTVGRTAEGARDWVKNGPRINVGCHYEPVRDWSSAEEQTGAGLQVVDLLLIYAKTWPGDVHSHVYINGQKYETSGAPQHFPTGRKTRHWRVTVKWIGVDDGQ